MEKVQPTESIEEEIAALIEKGARSYLEAKGSAAPELEIELLAPRKAEHGDWATNVAMKLAKTLRTKPLEIAEGICALIESSELIEPPEVAAPGFINVRLAERSVSRIIDSVLRAGERYGRSDAFVGRRLLIEFVSANPTGPLHIGHGRNAVVGDTLARIYEAVGHEVEREYYFNDAGVQMGLLGQSLRARYLERCGQKVDFPKDGYHGDYIKDLAEDLFRDKGEGEVENEDIAYFTERAASAIMKLIRADLAALGIEFDTYFSETSLHRSGKVKDGLDRLSAKGKLYEKDGALWLKTEEQGDDQDRVVRKSDGAYTYLAPDIAYHDDKFKRGFDLVVNVLGGDHHGYVPRLKAAVASLGYDPDRLHCVLIQMVGVEDSGETKKLSTRAGDFVPLKEIIEELGSDIVRFFFLVRSPESQMVFDLALAREQSMENPYYYLQYAHARCCSLLRKAEEAGAPWRSGEPVEGRLLIAREERSIALRLSRLPSALIEAARKDDPLPVVNYLRELATGFHAYFTAGNKDAKLRIILPDEPELTQARLTLIVALRQVLANGLKLLGLTPIERL